MIVKYFSPDLANKISEGEQKTILCKPSSMFKNVRGIQDK